MIICQKHGPCLRSQSPWPRCAIFGKRLIYHGFLTRYEKGPDDAPPPAFRRPPPAARVPTPAARVSCAAQFARHLCARHLCAVKIFKNTDARAPRFLDHAPP